jgi:hypothetical protein
MSAFAADEFYFVDLAPGKEGQCTCRQRCVHHVCWHIAACLLEQGVNEGSMITCLGSSWGSNQRGYAALYAQGETVSHELSCQAPADQQQNPLQHAKMSGAAGPDVTVNPVPYNNMPSVHTAQSPTKWLAMWAEMQDLRAQNPSHTRTIDFHMARIDFQIARTIETIKTIIANNNGILEPTPVTAMQKNPDAPTDNSVKRKVTWLEEASHKSRKKPCQKRAKVMAQAGPFIPNGGARKKKPHSVLAQLQEETAKALTHATPAEVPIPIAPQPIFCPQPQSVLPLQMPNQGLPTGGTNAALLSMPTFCRASTAASALPNTSCIYGAYNHVQHPIVPLGQPSVFPILNPLTSTPNPSLPPNISIPRGLPLVLLELLQGHPPFQPR